MEIGNPLGGERAKIACTEPPRRSDEAWLVCNGPTKPGRPDETAEMRDGLKAVSGPPAPGMRGAEVNAIMSTAIAARYGNLVVVGSGALQARRWRVAKSKRQVKSARSGSRRTDRDRIVRDLSDSLRRILVGDIEPVRSASGRWMPPLFLRSSVHRRLTPILGPPIRPHEPRAWVKLSVCWCGMGAASCLVALRGAGHGG